MCVVGARWVWQRRHWRVWAWPRGAEEEQEEAEEEEGSRREMKGRGGRR